MTERDPDLERVPGTEDGYRIDGRLFGQPGRVAVYVLDTPKPAVIDTGTADTTPDVVRAALEELDIARDEVAHLIPTHVHLDHAGGAGELARACPNATVHCHERGIDFLTDPELLEKLKRSVERALGMEAPYGDPDLVPAERARAIRDGDTIDLGDRTLEAIDAPGHAPHQACFFDGTTDTMFVADAAGMLLEGDLSPATQPPNFDLEDAVSTVRRLQTFDPETLCYPHFGVATDATARLETYEAMLPEWVETVAAAAETTDDPLEIANDLREEWGSMGLEGDVAGVLQYLEETGDTRRSDTE
ncbi:MBL fold metallo-hydrolase [Halopiger goleimassiliensis]|uniref:MBL fold metallo-hydrolase n=1 Tax=Halopiger goleimassiliensis TaxID=1293048 RepID=UPI0018A85289|nr:MBL fold metallo-hydrolase [Halopiger goleimassiliensis]